MNGADALECWLDQIKAPHAHTAGCYHHISSLKGLPQALGMGLPRICVLGVQE